MLEPHDEPLHPYIDDFPRSTHSTNNNSKQSSSSGLFRRTKKSEEPEYSGPIDESDQEKIITDFRTQQQQDEKTWQVRSLQVRMQYC